jgi:hypothetical protein
MKSWWDAISAWCVGAKLAVIKRELEDISFEQKRVVGKRRKRKEKESGLRSFDVIDLDVIRNSAAEFGDLGESDSGQ